MNKFDEIVQGVKELYNRRYVYDFITSTESNGIRYINIKLGEWTVSGAKGDGYETIKRIRREARKRGLYFEDHSVYNHVYVYESDPLDVF